MPVHISLAQRRARLARRHRLLPETRVDDVAAIADSVVALHATDPVTVHLSAAARMRHPSVAGVERALYVDRSVVRHHAMRRTLWVATPAVARLVHAAATRRLVGPERRRLLRLLADNDVPDPDGWLDDARTRVLAAVVEHGPVTARALRELVPGLDRGLVMAPGKRYSATVSAHTRVLPLLGFEGAIVRARPAGTWVSGAYAWAATSQWLTDGLGEVAERDAARDLALRWLRCFGPGTATDLRWWAGWTAATTRAALADCEAVPVLLDGGPGWVAPGDECEVEPVGPWVALLPGLDPTTMGWKQRDWYLDAAVADCFDAMGNAGPTIWVDGQVVGGWDQRPDGTIAHHLAGKLDPVHRELLVERTAALTATLGETRFSVRFPSPISSGLRQST